MHSYFHTSVFRLLVLLHHCILCTQITNGSDSRAKNYAVSLSSKPQQSFTAKGIRQGLRGTFNKKKDGRTITKFLAIGLDFLVTLLWKWATGCPRLNYPYLCEGLNPWHETTCLILFPYFCDFHRRTWQHLLIFHHFSPGTVLPEHFSYLPTNHNGSYLLLFGDVMENSSFAGLLSKTISVACIRVTSSLQLYHFKVPRCPPKKESIKLVDEQMLPQDWDAPEVLRWLRSHPKCSRPVKVTSSSPLDAQMSVTWLSAWHPNASDTDSWKLASLASDSYQHWHSKHINTSSMSRNRNTNIFTRNYHFNSAPVMFI